MNNTKLEEISNIKKKVPNIILCNLIVFFTTIIIIGLYLFIRDYNYYKVYDDLSWLNVSEVVWYNIKSTLITVCIMQILFQIPFWISRKICKNKTWDYWQINILTSIIGLIFTFSCLFLFFYIGLWFSFLKT